MFSLKGADCSWKQFFRFMLPSVAAMLLFSLYTVVDGIFVAWGAGEMALTSVNIAMPFINTLSGFSILISMGTATLVAFAKGRGDEKEANDLFSQTVIVIVAVSAAITLLVALFAKPIAGFLGAGPQTIGDTTSYLRIVSLFSICFILSYCLEVMVKVDDNPKMAIIGVAASFFTNVALDYLMVIQWGWGVVGAAWATGIAQVLSLAIFLWYFFSKRSHLKLGRFRPQPRAFLRIFPLGIADFSVEMIVAFLTFLYNHVLLFIFGESSLTIYAVIAYVNLFVFMVMQGVSQGMMHLVSFHTGKGENDTAKGYFKMCILSGLVISVCFTLLCQAAPQFIAGLLLKPDSAVFAEAVRALQMFSLSFPFVGLNIAIAGYFTAREMALPSVSLSISRGFVFAPIAIVLCAFLWNGTWIWMAALLGELACFLVSAFTLYRSREKLDKAPQDRGELPKTA